MQAGRTVGAGRHPIATAGAEPALRGALRGGSPRTPVKVFGSMTIGSMDLGNRGLDKVAGGFSGGEEAAPQPLFRQEALDAAADTGFGRPVALYPMSWLGLAAGLLAMVVLFAVLLVNGNYNRKETVTGIVRSVGGEVRVIASMPGTVSELNAAEGQKVKQGDPLLTIATARIGVDGKPADTLALESIDEEIDSLVSRLQALDSATGIEQRGRSSRLAALRSELSSARFVESAGAQRLALAEGAFAKIQPLAEKGYVSGEQMRRRQEEIIAIRQAMAESDARQANIVGQLGELEAVRDQTPYALAQEKGRLLDQISKAQRERQGYLSQRAYVVRAPASGIVTALQASRGQSVDPARPLMTITSSGAGAGAMAEVYVPSRAIGFLEPGQRVRVRYDAFPFERFGTAEGKVKAISASVLRPEEVQAAVAVQEPMYRVLVALERDTVKAYGRSYRVQSGFALTADIVLEERSFISWLLDPLLSLRGRM
jgi:membrane fusion protein